MVLPAKVFAKIQEFQTEQGDFWQPSAMLKRLAESGKTFAKPD